MKKKSPKLNQEEKELLESFNKGEWKQVKNYKTESAMAKRAANNFLAKNVFHCRDR